MIEKRDYFQLLLHFLLIVVLSLIQIIYPIFVSEILTVQSTVNSIFAIVCSLIVGKMIVNICDLIWLNRYIGDMLIYSTLMMSI